MDVLNVKEDKLGVVVGVLILVSAALGHVGHGVHLWPCIVDVNSMRLGVSVHDEGDHFLVLAAALPRHPCQRLRAPCNRCQTANKIISFASDDFTWVSSL